MNDKMEDLKNIFKTLINKNLPETYQSPVRYNHCFNRIILDWLFQDVWYFYLQRNQTAIGQLTEEQLCKAIERMNGWLQHPDTLLKDNADSLIYRKARKRSQTRL